MTVRVNGANTESLERHSGGGIVTASSSVNVPRAKALIAMLHPLPVLMTVLAAIGFAVIADKRHPTPSHLAIVALTIGLSQVAIAVYNDVRDLDMDAKAHSERALPAGQISVRMAHVLTGIATLGCLLVASLRGPTSLLLVAIGTALGLAYSATFKRTIWSWAPFALAFPLLPVWVFVALDHLPKHLWSIFVVGMPLAVAIHIADSLPDVETDAEHGAKGVATSLGRGRASKVLWASAFVASFSAVILSPLTNHAPLAAAGAIAMLGVVAEWARVGPRAGLQRHLVGVGGVLLATCWVAALTL